MIQTLNFLDFCDGFQGGYKDNFSYEGKRALFDYLEELEEGTGEPLEFDPIALCCEYSEFAGIEDIKNNYENIKTLEDLEDRTTVIKVDGTDRLIIQEF